MNSRERLDLALKHKQADRIPLDLGSMYESSIVKSTYIDLRRYLGLDTDKSIELFDVIQQLPVLGEDFLQYLKVDVRGVFPGPSSRWVLDIRQEGDYRTFTDEWGIKWFMPVKNGYYFDARSHPMRGLELEDIKNFDYPDFSDPARYQNLRTRVQEFKKNGYAVVSGAGVGIMLMSSWLRGMDQFFIDMASDKKLANYLLDRVTESACNAWESSLDQIGDILDVASTGDDLSNQISPLVSMDMFEEMLKPRYKKIIDTIKGSSQARVSFHSCGSVYSFIPHLIDIGVDVLNPVQVSARDMDTKRLKKEFGKDIVFWGGGCDTQKVLPFGTPAEVREEVKKRIGDLASGGGFVFNQVHNIQAKVPAENIMAMYETLWEYGKYQ